MNWQDITIDELQEFAQDWRTLKETQEHFKLPAYDSWKIFSRVIKVYTNDFEYRDCNKLKAGVPYMYRSFHKK